VADTTNENLYQKTAAAPDLDKPVTKLGAQAANSLTSRNGDAAKLNPSETAKANADSVYGTLDVSSLATSPSAQENQAMDRAHEVVKDAAGNDKFIPLGKLKAGDHTIALKDGREFMMHVPPNDGKEKLPVMFMFSGSGEGQWNIKDFVPECGMNTKADDPKNKFIAVYPLPQRHLLGTGSDKTAYGWNVLDQKGGVLIDKADSANAGYDDMVYVKDIAKLIPQVANVDATHKDWAGVGFSHGGVFLNYLASNVPALFPTVVPIGSGLDTKYNYDVKPGNAQNVDIVNLRGDLETMPFLNKTDDTFKAEKVLRDILPKDIFEKLDDLAPINNSESDPAKQMAMYERRLGKSIHHTTLYATPSQSQTSKDSVTRYIPKDRNNHDRVTVVNLATAQHSFPEADPSNKRTNATTKYTEFDTDQQIIDTWFKFNKQRNR
jgi:poly(3-hydroxybutyrate) depolymerase